MNITSILIPALIVGLLGLVFGALLGYASIKFKVEKDENIDKVLENLPGANCGGCGFAGCAAMAEAIVLNGEKVTKCNLVSEAQCASIAKILGIKTEKVVKKYAVVKCLGCKDVALDKYDYEGICDCNLAYQLGGGPKECEYGCMGLGSCVNACRFGAISIENGIAKVDKEKCTGCGACANVCPKKVIDLVSETQYVNVLCNSNDKGAVVKNYCTQGCIGCMLCKKNCPNEAMIVENNLAHIDEEKCTNCGECAKACPKKVISL